MLAGAFWGFIPGFLKAVSGAHEVVTTIMLNFIAIAFLACAGQRAARRPGLAVADHARLSATPSLPIILGRNGHLGIIYRADHGDPLRVPPVPDDARLRDPDRGREPGRRALRRDVAASG